MVIAGTNIPPNTTATAVTATTITLSNNVTGAGVAAGASIIVAPNTFTGVSATAPPAAPNNNYSRIHTFLRGAVTAGPLHLHLFIQVLLLNVCYLMQNIVLSVQKQH